MAADIQFREISMKSQLSELIGCISSGCMPAEEIERIAEEAAQAYADAEAFLRANPDINYDEDFPIPLGEWVVVGSLPDTVLFQADRFDQLFTQIRASFGPSVSFNLQPKQLAKVDTLTALRRMQVQLSSLYPEKGGYVLMNFSMPLDDELQAVLVFDQDLARTLELCAAMGIAASAAFVAASAVAGLD